MGRRLGLVVGGLVVALSGVASAQNQIRPRVLIMVDTSGSMTEHFTDSFSTGGDGSTFYSDAVMTRAAQSNGNNGMYVGFSLPANTCPATQFDGVNSRMFAAKAAVTNVINGSGDIDWGLMRYSGTVCGVVNTTGGTGSNCSTDDDCIVGEFCLANKCHTDKNLCVDYGFGPASCGAGCSAGYGATRTSGGTCTNSFNNDNGNALTYNGSCGTGVAAGNALCATPQVCYADTDCSGGGCTLVGTGPIKECACTGNAQCPGAYTCTGGRCVYNQGCQDPGGVILVDPSTTGSSASVLPYVDGVEALPGNLAGIAVNPELRAVNATPLAGAARSAAAWYKSVSATDTQSACRPYVLVQMTDGFDSCDADTANGPVAAAGSFVAATVAGARNPNKVYVIGLAFGNNPSPTLDAIAHAGGTGNARLANSQSDIESALADIVASSVLVEKCNGMDDNCNNQCDENFPDVAVPGTDVNGVRCTNVPTTGRAANSCNNGYPAGTHCAATGIYVCSTDQLSEACQAPQCIGAYGAMLSQPAAGTMRLSGVNGITSSMIGEVLYVAGAAQAADDGLFVITAVGNGTVDVANGAFVADSSTVSYGVPQPQGVSASIAVNANVETIVTAPTNQLVNVNDTIRVVGALPAALNGTFVVTSATVANGALTIKFNNTTANTTATTQGHWADDINLCPTGEIPGGCNNIDDDCNGVVDDCTPGVPGSCCMTCQKQPEICNGKDDDCDGEVDGTKPGAGNTIDSGGPCSSNDVGDCAPGIWKCCSADPNMNGGACSQVLNGDSLWCAGGNPGFPMATDQCDGTDDNCNGTPNDQGPKLCYTDPAGNPLGGTPGVGICHNGTAPCTTVPLCAPCCATASCTNPAQSCPSGCVAGTCPTGWPSYKVCPNPNKTYGTPTDKCDGAVGAQLEMCNGQDDDCNSCIDDNVHDTWVGQDCCPTGNLADCDNTTTNGVTGTRCHRGKFQCFQAGGACTPGAKTCVGAVAKTTETCNMVDDDCDGVVDDVPGVGTSCTGPGIYTLGTCVAKNECDYSTNPGTVKCTQVVGPGMETCNGKDDNCNGLIDDNGPPNAVNPLPGVGLACDQPMPPNDKPPCKAGMTVCQAGMIVCIGAVGPMPNQCNGISTDCTGNPNTNGNCPTGFQCYQGNCVEPCSNGEFPCPGGYACNTQTNLCDVNGMHTGCCVPDACATLTCPAGYICKLDANGMGQCTDPCIGVTCDTGFICKVGVCVDASCRTQGCPDGQVCTNVGMNGTNDYECVPDPCASITCDSNQYCDNGQCVGTCAGPCPPGDYCSQGSCVPDPCAHVPCVEGQVCQISNGVGTCVEDNCQFGCSIGQACCGGACVADGCQNLHCPEDTHCALTPDCKPTCETNPASPKVEVVGAGGGGVGCAVGGSGSPQSSSLAWLIVVAGALLFRRRRTAEVRK